MAKYPIFSIDNLSHFKEKILDYLPNVFALKSHTHTIDSSLNESSSNPIQNKIVTLEFNEMQESIDGLSSSLNSHNHDTVYKKIQKAVSSPSASGNAVSFIDTISQDTQGKITATKKTIDLSPYKEIQETVPDPTASGTSITFIDTISQNAQGVIATTKKTVKTMGAATSSATGSTGLVPAPAAGKQSSFLRGDGTWVVPTNTKNTAGSTNSSSKLFLIGATSQAASPQTYSHDTVYIGTDGCLYSNSTKVSVEGHNHDSIYYSQTQLDEFLNTKVDKVSGKGLSTNDFTTALLDKLNGIAEGAQVNTITGVKGSSESSYRTGNVNITKANIGLGNVNNTADTAKPVSTAQQAAIDLALATAKSYTDSSLSAIINASDDGVTLNSIEELATAITENEDAITTLNNIAGSKASATDLTNHTNNKSNPHGVNLSQLGVTATATELNILDGATVTVSELNKLDGATITTAELNMLKGIGTSTVKSQLDAKLPTSTYNTHKADTTHITSDERTSWNAAKTHADSAHAPSNAEKNQNAFSNFTIGSTTIAADTTTDTLTLTGSNVTLTPNADTDSLQIGITKTNITTALGYTPPTQDTTYNVVSSTANGLAPKTGTAASATIGTQSTEWVLTSTSGGTPTWRKLPANAFKNDDTNTATAADNILDGSNNGTQITYAPYASSVATSTWVGTSGNSGKLYLGSVNPTASTRLNYNGYFYSTKLYSGGIEVSTTNHTHSYAGSSSVGGAANSVKGILTIGASTYNGSGNVTAPTASTSAYGITKLSSSINTDSDVLAATSSAVKSAYDLADTAKTNAANVQTNLNTHTSNKSNPHGVTLAQLGVTATAAELNKMDGVTATTAELNFVDGVTSNIQTQLNGKVNGVYTIIEADETPSSPTANTIYLIPEGEPNSTTPYIISSTEPTNTNKIWIDSGNYNILKVYTGTEWTPIGAVYS